MSGSPLTALSPLDGRYRTKVADLAGFFSEYGLIRYRVRIEIEWLKALSAWEAIPELPPFTAAVRARLDQIAAGFSVEDAESVKRIESQTNHDVKAIEYWIRGKLSESADTLPAQRFVHFACTSEDINNLSYALMFEDSRRQALLPGIDAVISSLIDLARATASLPMLSRTHGQPATPTTLGKEIANVVARLKRQRHRIASVRLTGKINGAVGNYNAHLAAYPANDWEGFCRGFVQSLGLEFNEFTTQIEPHDSVAELFDAYAALNTVLIDFNRDAWGYISLGYFRQRIKEGEVGSSTMPHKVNPIDFENSEGNLGIANALLGHLAAKLPISRWQRDLTDSTVLRSSGVALGYALLSYDSCLRGIRKLLPDEGRLAADLSGNWDVLAEAVQTVMKRHGIADAYEQLKALTRGKAGIDRAALHDFIRQLAIPEAEKTRLLDLSPSSYTGLAETLARRI